jgi:hypothetical protein
MATEKNSPSEIVARIIQTGSVVIGVVISVLSFTSGQRAAANARIVEAMKPFQELRQKQYMEAVQAAAVLANPTTHTNAERLNAARRFRDLYVAELSMVESFEVEARMKKLAAEVAPDLIPLDGPRRAAYCLAHALRLSFVESWGVQLSEFSPQRQMPETCKE